MYHGRAGRGGLTLPSRPEAAYRDEKDVPTILVVDDDRTIRDGLVRTIAGAGGLAARAAEGVVEARAALVAAASTASCSTSASRTATASTSSPSCASPTRTCPW